MKNSKINWRKGCASFVALAVLLCTGIANSQQSFDPMSAGRHYVLTFPDTARNVRDNTAPRFEEKWLAFVYSPVNTRLRVSAPGIHRAPVNIAGGRTTLVDFRSTDFMIPNVMTTEPLCRPSRATVFLDADDPIIVTCFLSTAFGAEAWTPLPVEAWGTEYYAIGYPGELVKDVTMAGYGWPSMLKRGAPAEIVVVAAFDGTRVVIAPTGPLAGNCSGDILLNAGESVVVESATDTTLEDQQPGLAGSRIFATKPIGVITGNTRVQIIPEVTSMTGNTTRNMQVEWLTPVEGHGTTFVYMPTWDTRRPTGLPGEILSEKRSTELVKIYGTHGETTTGSISNGTPTATAYEAPIPIGGSLVSRQIPTHATVHTTSNPAQVMMSAGPVGVLKTTGGYGWWSTTAETWGGYSVELVPRERWTTFAPLYAPASPSGLEHYVNLVVDTAHASDVVLSDGRPFPFSRPIPGTDLIWGSMGLQAGGGTWVEGRRGARFGGFVYGTYTGGGHEEFRWTPRREYEEWIGIAYGYPVASSHIVVGVRDTIRIEDVDLGCGSREYRLSVVNAGAAGLRSIELVGAVNARQTPGTPWLLIGSLTATVTVEPVDRTADASGRLLVTSRAGDVLEIPIAYVAMRATMGEGNTTSFGTLTTVESASRRLPLLNVGTVPVIIDQIRVGPSKAFAASAEAEFPIVLDPGEATSITVATRTSEVHGTILDTLTVTLSCGEIRHQLAINVIAPTINVSNLDLGTVVEDARASGTAILQNTSVDTLKLNASPDAVIIWEGTHFAISNQTREKLAGLALTPGSSVEIPVTFLGGAPGDYSTVAHVRSNAVSGNATSTWRIRVSEISAVESVVDGDDAVTVFPIPARDRLVVHATAGTAPGARCDLFDAQGIRRFGATMTADGRGTRASLDVAQLSSGLYLLRISIGDRRINRRIVISR